MNIIEHFTDIVKDIDNPTIFEFGTCDGKSTNILCSIMENMNKKYSYHAFELDYRLIRNFWENNSNRREKITFNHAAIGNENKMIKVNLSSGHETREGHFKQEFYGSSSIRKPKETLKCWPDMKFSEFYVKCSTFDSYCQENNIQKIDFVWCDIQGAEKDLILGGSNSFKKVKYFYTEYSTIELYEDQLIGTEDLISMLPGKWSVVEKYDSDILLKNEGYEE